MYCEYYDRFNSYAITGPVLLKCLMAKKAVIKFEKVATVLKLDPYQKDPQH
jgi:hypothetical protein